MRIDKAAWKEAAWVFLLSRLVIIVLTYVGSGRLPLAGQSGLHNCGLSLNDCFLSWLHYGKSDALQRRGSGNLAPSFCPAVGGILL